MENSGDSFQKKKKKKLKIVQLNDPAIPLLGIYPEKAIIWKDTCIPVFSEPVYNSQDV